MSRELILDKIRRSLGRGPLSGEALEHVKARLASPRPNLVPKRSDLGALEVTALFEQLVKKQAITMERIADERTLPSALAGYLDAHSIQKNVKLAPDPRLTALPWQESSIVVRSGPAESTDEVGVSVAFRGIAETGTMMFVSGPDSPIALCFLPPVHVVLLRESDLVKTMEDAWTAVRERFGAGSMPRVALFVSGTSATGDVGQTIVRGASGPLKVHLFLS